MFVRITRDGGTWFAGGDGVSLNLGSEGSVLANGYGDDYFLRWTSACPPITLQARVDGEVALILADMIALICGVDV